MNRSPVRASVLLVWEDFSKETYLLINGEKVMLAK